MKKIVVLGGGISGYGSAILAKKQGFEVFLSDMGTIAPQYREKLEEWSVDFEEGQHTEDKILSADLVIKSPGIPDSAPMIVKIKNNSIPIISEIEFAGRYMGHAKTICITGSNGKTTTTSLIYKILSDAGYRVSLGGNIGESFAYSVATGEFDWYVLELSSFQLDGMFDFRADIAVLLNITPDHLDRYEYRFENYVASKMRVINNQKEGDAFIYFDGDPTIKTEVNNRNLKMTTLPFSLSSIETQGGALNANGEIEVKVGDRTLQFPASKMLIEGAHNVYNAQAAALAALAAGVDAATIESSICSFSPVEHRLEPVAQLNGVQYINDSKATNVDSVWYALESMTRPVVWIAGGKDKGNDYSTLVKFAKEKVHTLVCMGVNNTPLEKAFDGVVPNIISCHSFEEAMVAARKAASPGDVVLLSPACASFDLFKSYEHRGKCFKEWVLDSNNL